MTPQHSLYLNIVFLALGGTFCVSPIMNQGPDSTPNENLGTSFDFESKNEVFQHFKRSSSISFRVRPSQEELSFTFFNINDKVITL